MKKLLVLGLTLLLSGAAQAQTDVTRFLGIPVDGSKSEMIRQLKEKGFRSSSYKNDVLEGEFNGSDVQIAVATNNNKVWRIMVIDAQSTDESNIKIRFNHLCKQFENNPKYFALENDQTISDKEDISYEMTVHKKRYQAAFYQRPISIDSSVSAKDLKQHTKKSVWFLIYEEYGKYSLIMFYDNEYNQANGDDL